MLRLAMIFVTNVSLSWFLEGVLSVGEDETTGMYGWRRDGWLLGVPRPNGLSMLIDLAVSKTLGLEGPWVRTVSCECLHRGKDGEFNLAVLMFEVELSLLGELIELSEGLAFSRADVVFLTLLTLRKSSSPGTMVGSDVSSDSS
jgi:hypothetical protein